MTGYTRAALLAMAGALVLLPFAVLHPLVSHFGSQGHGELERGLTSPGLAALVGIAAAGMVPALLLVIALGRACRASGSVAKLRSTCQATSHAGIRYWRARDDQIALMTVGFWRPAIIVTTGAERALSNDQLRAALLHEQAHQRRRDVLWRVVFQAVTRPFSVLPSARSLTRRTILRTECLADDEALRHGASRSSLFEAMVTAASGGGRPCSANLTDGAVEYRLIRLARHDTTLPPGPTRGLGAIGACVAALPIAAHLLIAVGLVCGA